MTLVVQKYGGTSVADLDRIRNVAARVKRQVAAGDQVAVVVSAMAGSTNQLVSWVHGLDAAGYDTAEYDQVVASGEQVTVGLLAIALQTIGVPARSFLGWQAGFATDARLRQGADRGGRSRAGPGLPRRRQGRGGRRIPGPGPGAAG